MDSIFLDGLKIRNLALKKRPQNYHGNELAKGLGELCITSSK